MRPHRFGRALAAVREKDFAAAVIGVNHVLFQAAWRSGCSSFLGGIAGAVLAFCYYRAVTPEQFDLDVSIQALAMVIVGGLASVIGSFLGAALVFFAPIVLNNVAGALAHALGLSLSGDVLLANSAHSLRRAHHGISLVRAARPCQDLGQSAQLFPGVAVPACPALNQALA